ncbi:hypothetical protein SAMN05216565_101406 [Litchfieldia salsa]|uniref:Uncharacterized protein n=1 Tax=Litchfieldia salsa TaxID=930152 RepID=A0A1H0PNX0_9BACI|nr:hypothetical protein SAMN05216565_101406 [Litchfieldia salsa]
MTSKSIIAILITVVALVTGLYYNFNNFLEKWGQSPTEVPLYSIGGLAPISYELLFINALPFSRKEVSATRSISV